jgi:hypothetical protein
MRGERRGGRREKGGGVGREGEWERGGREGGGKGRERGRGKRRRDPCSK